MNFLAHIFLAYPSTEKMMGNMIADFIQKRDEILFSDAICDGIKMHRAIDAFTDVHECVRLGARRLHPKFHKYAPVVIDIYYDYLLAKNWETFNPTLSLSDFSCEVYRRFEERITDFPPNLQQRLPKMIAANWLEAYGTEAGMRYTFQRLSQRTTKFPMDFSAAFDTLLIEYEQFDAEFKQFFPQIQKYLFEKGF